MTLTIRRLSGIALAAILLLAPAAASAQDSKSATSVIELVKMLDSMKLDSFAVKGACGKRVRRRALLSRHAAARRQREVRHAVSCGLAARHEELP